MRRHLFLRFWKQWRLMVRPYPLCWSPLYHHYGWILWPRSYLDEVLNQFSQTIHCTAVLVLCHDQIGVISLFFPHFSNDVIKNSRCYLLKSLFCAFRTVKRPLCKLLNPRQINISACANSQLVLPLILWLLWESCFTVIMGSSYFGLFMIQLLLLQMGMLISRKFPRKIRTLLRVSIVEYLMNWSDVFTTVWS